jgi:hypothetical protein
MSQLSSHTSFFLFRESRSISLINQMKLQQAAVSAHRRPQNHVRRHGGARGGLLRRRPIRHHADRDSPVISRQRWGVAQQAGASGSGGTRAERERRRQERAGAAAAGRRCEWFPGRMRVMLDVTVICRAPIFFRPPQNPNFGSCFQLHC